MAQFEAGAIEVAMGVKPLQEILEEREHLVNQRAELWARYGPFGTWDHERKAMLASLRLIARANALKAGVKATEASLDDEAHGHPDYTEFVRKALVERARLNKLDEAINALDFTINRGQSLLRLSGRLEVGA